MRENVEQILPGKTGFIDEMLLKKRFLLSLPKKTCSIFFFLSVIRFLKELGIWDLDFLEERKHKLTNITVWIVG